MLAGAENPTGRVIEAALMTIGLRQGVETPSSFFLMQWPDRALIFADCAVNFQPNATQLASIAISAAASAEAVLGETPRMALLSFSTKGSGDHSDADKVIKAVKIARERAPELLIDGELQGDAALSPSVAARKVKEPSEVAGRANVLVFPDLDAGNIAYKLTQYLSGAQAIGPILQGFAQPVSDLSRGATVDDIVATGSLLLAMGME
jgi:phosphate acetyltransferase